MPARTRVILNDRALRSPRTGVGHYIIELLAALARQTPDIDLLPFYSRCFSLRRHQKTATSDPSASGASVYRPARRPPAWLRRIAQDTYFAAFEAYAVLRGYSLYHEPNHIPAPWHGPILTTMHDVSVIRHPQWHPPDRVTWYDRDFAAGLARTHHFIAVSEFTRREMVDLLGVDARRITVIPLGARTIFHPRPPDEVRARLHERNLPNACVLYVGTIEPRKNVPGVLAAYARLPASLRAQHPLVLAGVSGWGQENVEALIRENLLDGVRVLGYVSDEDLAYLYNAARVLVWPTFYEGFGLPPLEAMASGTPVISSSISSIPEVVGDAGILIEPRDVDALTESLRRVLEDDALAESLIIRGLARSRLFSWSRCAAEHATLYRRFATE